MDNRKIVVVRGAGDLASGTIFCLHQCGFRVAAAEIEQPTAIRTGAAFCQAMYEGSVQVEGETARRAESLEEISVCWQRDEIPIVPDPDLSLCLTLQPDILVDAAIAKRNLGTRMDMAPLVIALGPGFTAGKDCCYVIETMRGHNLARIISRGSALANTGVPGIIAGFGKERVIHAPAEGIFTGIAAIGDTVRKGQLIARVGDCPVSASIDGLLRGILHDGLFVPEGFKIADIDPRLSEKQNCFTISDKARAIAGSVLTAICMDDYRNQKGIR